MELKQVKWEDLKDATDYLFKHKWGGWSVGMFVKDFGYFSFNDGERDDNTEVQLDQIYELPE